MTADAPIEVSVLPWGQSQASVSNRSGELTSSLLRPTAVIVLIAAAMCVLSLSQVGHAQEPGQEAAVHFEDAQLKAAVEAELGIADPTPTDMLRLISLDAGSKQISDLAGLEYASRLSELGLDDNLIFDLAPLSELTNLTVMELASNRISDLSPLSDLANLAVLYLSDNQISDVSPLSELRGLVELCLHENQISDLSPLAQLTDLTDLCLHDNQISDLSPLSGLTNLSLLYLWNNQVSDLSPLSELTNLTDLCLHQNQISDLSPLSQLTNLTVLYLWGNQISDLSALSQLTETTELYLSHNQISDLSGLSQLTKLTCLYLDYNQISRLSDLSSLRDLTELHLSHNQISSVSPLSTLANLEELDISVNLISDLSALSHLANLAELDLSVNSISTIAELSGLARLNVLDLGGNGISDLSPLSELTNLAGLDLSGNQISDLAPVSELRNLASLILTDNSIADLHGLSELTNVRVLNLINNQVRDLSSLSRFSNLTHLYIDGNRIHSLSPLSQLTNLINLSAKDNEIVDLSPLAGMTKLESLSMYMNQIADVSALGNLLELNDLRLSNNNLSDLSSLAALTQLKTLDLSNNQIADVSALAGLDDLIYLYLSGNSIADVSALSSLTQLTTLYLGYNEVRDISALSSLTQLTRLYLGYNKIHDVSALSSLTQLTTLYLLYNEVQDISALAGLTQLTAFWVSDNRIDDISALAGLTQLRDLGLSDNNIPNVSSLAGLGGLVTLNLHDNQVTDITPLAGLADLEYLDISGNPIEDITALEQLTNLGDLNLQGLPLTCSDAICTAIDHIRQNNPYVRISLPNSLILDECPSHIVYFVDDDAVPGGDGSSWANALRHLQDALLKAKPGDEIRVAQGIYKPAVGKGVTPGDRGAVFRLMSGLSVIGGYAGNGCTDPNARNTEKYATILSGDLQGNDEGDWDDPSRGDNSLNVVIADKVDNTAVLDGFVIEGARGSRLGGGMRCAHGFPTVENCVFRHNSATFGGGLYHSRELTMQSLLNFHFMSMRLIDCHFYGNHAVYYGGAVSEWSNVGIRASNLELYDCRFDNNSAGRGGAGIYDDNSVKLVNCLFRDHPSDTTLYCAGSRVTRTIDDVTFLETNPNNIQPRGALLESAIIRLDGNLSLLGCTLTICQSTVDGPGDIELDSNGAIRITSRAGLTSGHSDSVTRMRVSVCGPGRIEIDAGQQLILEGNALVDLGSTTGDLPGPNGAGRIVVDGSLVVRGNATIENTNIDVKLLEVDDPNTIQHNNITLLEASTGFGGEFFVGGNATIRHNIIVSEGDRYLDLDPNPEGERHPSIEYNRITVVIKEGTLSNQGTLLELRARDFDAGTVVNPGGSSGAYQVAATSPGFTEDPSENWVLERLSLEPNAKLNLTNRQGFRYQGPDEPYPETVYIKDLVMAPNSVLNTALQTMYYQHLVDPNGTELARDPADPYAPLANGARFTDIPVLGFSLGIIAMNDQMEFDVRVRRRLTDPADDPKQPPDPAEPFYIGSIERVDPSADPSVRASTGGVMEMRTQAENGESATSVAAKGAFARAGDEDITIEFEYSFLDDPYGEAEIIVYLSDHPEVSKDRHQPYEVARIYPPAGGRPGSIGSSQFAVFSGTFSRRDLNFTRGTYVELELRGRSVRCWIDNWDPKVFCNTCGDYDGMGFLDITDYYLLLAGLGTVNPGSDDTRKGCLDLATDGCVTVADLLSWEVMGPLNACPWRSSPAYVLGEAASGLQITSTSKHTAAPLNSIGSLLILGKSDAVDENGMPRSVLASPDGLATPTGISGTGRLVKDGRGRIYQVDPSRGIIDLENSTVVAGPQELKPFRNHLVSVGFSEGRGVPLMDAAFDRKDPNLVYVVPVQVTSEGSAGPYVGAARLRLTGGGDYAVEALYGSNPSEVSTHTVTNESAVAGFLNEPDLQHLQEIEIDPTGKHLFVLSGCWHNQNNWVIVYDTEHPEPQGTTIWLNDPNAGSVGLVGPSAMVVSAVSDALYMVSSAQNPNDQKDLVTEVYCYEMNREDGQVTELKFDHTITVEFPAPVRSICNLYPNLCDLTRSLSMITSLTEDPHDGTLYVTGFSSPRFQSDVQWPAFGTSLFTTPALAVVRPGKVATEAVGLVEPSPFIPLSVVCTGTTGEDNDEDQ